MQDFIEEIYEYAQLIPAIKEVVSDSYKDRDSVVRSSWNSLQPVITSFCDSLTASGSPLGRQILASVSSACSNLSGSRQFMNAFADGLEASLPLFYEAMKPYSGIDISEGKYRIFSSRSGFLSLESLSTGRPFHSLTDPMWEAHEQALKIFSPHSLAYSFLGCGLGYLPWQIFCESDQSADIYIYHNDPKVIDYALDYGVLSWIPEDKLHIIIKSDNTKLINMFLEDIIPGQYLTRQCMYDILDSLSDKERLSISSFQTLNYTKGTIGPLISINASRNNYNMSKSIYQFKPQAESREWIVAVAGPSLDSQLDYIRKNEGIKPVICASTVFKKLLNEGIRPDAVCVLDPQARTFGHLSGVENETVPLLMSNIANWRFGEYYSGPKYVVPNFDDPDSVSFYRKINVEPLYLGSTVSSMSIQIAATLGAKTIHLCGLDLSYPGGHTHAKGTMDEKTRSTNGMLMIPSQSGGTVPTTPQFMVYINEINDIISRYPGIKFINHSRIGARFNGTFND